MSEWAEASMDNLYYDNSLPSFNWQCFVRKEGGMLHVKYDDDDETLTWRGEEISPGHFKLQLLGGNGHARLHAFPGGKVYVGEWIEDGEKGTWRISID